MATISTSIKELSGVPDKTWSSMSWKEKLKSLNTKTSQKNIKKFVGDYGEAAGAELLATLLPIFTTLGVAAQATTGTYSIVVGSVIPTVKGVLEKIKSATFPPPVGIASGSVGAAKQGAGVALVLAKQLGEQAIDGAVNQISEMAITIDTSSVSSSPVSLSQITSTLNGIDQGITTYNQVLNIIKQVSDGIKSGVEGFAV